MKSLHFVMIVSLVLSHGIAVHVSAADDDATRKVFKIHPAGESHPALKYPLLHEVIDQKPGNAALAYQRAFSGLATQRYADDEMKMVQSAEERRDNPFPIEQIKPIVERYADTIRQLERASHYEDCDWQTTIREDGMYALLPHLGQARRAARLLDARIGVDIAEDRFDDAVRHIRVGLVLARHAGGGETLIESLVGIAIQSMMLNRIEELVQIAGAPNLYWSVSNLPTPLLDVQDAMRWERWWLFASLPDLKTIDTQPIDAARFKKLFGDFSAFTGTPSQSGALGELQATAVAIAAYPLAKQALIERGRDKADVEAMLTTHVIALAMVEKFREDSDEMFKWMPLPYWHAAEPLAQLERAFSSRGDTDVISLFSSMLLPALSAARLSFARIDRQVAMLRCVEAIRLHTAQSNGVLPATLGNITSVPLPIDPMTGEPFIYRVDGGAAIIEAPMPPHGRKRDHVIYEVTIAK